MTGEGATRNLWAWGLRHGEGFFKADIEALFGKRNSGVLVRVDWHGMPRGAQTIAFLNVVRIPM